MKIRLDELEEGALFRFNNTIALKSEYINSRGGVLSYIVGSGECFWGGTTTSEELNGLMVTQIKLNDLLNN